MAAPILFNLPVFQKSVHFQRTYGIWCNAPKISASNNPVQPPMHPQANQIHFIFKMSRIAHNVIYMDPLKYTIKLRNIL